MKGKNAVGIELLKITALVIALLVVGLVLPVEPLLWLKEATNREILGTDSQKNLLTPIEIEDNGGFVVDLLLNDDADVRNISSDSKYDLTDEKDRILFLISAQSCYQALAIKMQSVDYFSSELTNSRLNMDVVVYGNRKALRRDLLLYKKVYRPSYNLYYLTVVWEEEILNTDGIAIVQKGEMFKINKKDLRALQDDRWPFADTNG